MLGEEDDNAVAWGNDSGLRVLSFVEVVLLTTLRSTDASTEVTTEVARATRMYDCVS